MDFARLNHILIPDTKDERDKFRQSRIGRLAKPLVNLYLSLTPEGRFLSVFWLLSGAASVDVGGTRTYILWSLVSTLLFVVLILRRRYTLDGVRVSISAASEVVRGEILPISIRLENQTSVALTAFRVEGPLLPWDGTYIDGSPVVPFLDGGAIRHAVARASFRARGEHHLDPFFVARVVPPGLSLGPSYATEGVRFVVVPRPAHIHTCVLPAPSSDEAEGARRAFGVNDDPEMAGVRPYRPGDQLRDLHARSWARVGYPVVREYELPIEARIALRLECGETTTDELFEGAVELAAGLVQHFSERKMVLSLAVPGAEHGWLSIQPGSIALGQAMQRLGCVMKEHRWPTSHPPVSPIGTSHTLVVRAQSREEQQVPLGFDGVHNKEIMVVEDGVLEPSFAGVHCVSVNHLHSEEGLSL